jgi:hypothetical protein
MGEVNLLGLSAFGGEMAPLWGTIIGGSVSGITSMTLGHVQGGKMAKNRELFGLLAGLGTSGVMFAMKSTRPAAFGALVGAFLASGLSYLEKVLLGTVQLPAPVAAAATAVAAAAANGAAPPDALSGLGRTQLSYLNGLGMRQQAGGQYLNGPQVSYLNGLGIPSIAPQPQSVGTIPGVAGPSFAGTQMGTAAPVSLLGQASARSAQVSLLGGPPIHGLSAAYGATLLGAGR